MDTFKKSFNQWLLSKSVEWLMSYEPFMIFKFFASQTQFKYNYDELQKYLVETKNLTALYIDSFLNIITD